ncbi:sensor histidine kinase [Portibacter marinus]|uniref:sensor histidine kinase n=1 Tax=Portibacter marinus TaxID=2898660 RepID=UPI001F23DA45|nr:histidine kinase [Portibacter marinus]
MNNSSPLKTFTLKVLLYISIYLSTALFTASNAQYDFISYDYTSGLPLVEVNVIAEDSMGFIWLGGPEGLVRFDGSNFTHFRKGNDHLSLAGTAVMDIEITPSGNVFVLHQDNGVSLYNHETNTFRRRNYEPEDGDKFPKQVLYKSLIVNDSLAYLSSYNEGLYVLNLNTFVSRRLPVKLSPKDMIKVPGENNQLYLVDEGVFQFNTDTYEINSLTEVGFYGLQWLDGDLWFSDYSQYLYRYHPDNKDLVQYASTIKGVIRGWERIGENLWLAMYYGLEIIDAKTGEVVKILTAGPGKQNLNGNFIYDIFKDSKQRVWVSTDGGLNLYDPHQVSVQKAEMLKQQTSSLHELNSGALLSLDFYNHTVVLHPQDQPSFSLALPKELRNPIKVIEQENDLIIVCYNGIGRLDLKNQMISYLEIPFNNEFRKGLYDYTIVEDRHFAMYRPQQQFITWNSSSDQQDTFELQTVPLSIFADTEYLWIYGENSLDRYDIINEIVHSFSLLEGTLSKTLGKIVGIQRSGKHYWISSEKNGLFKARQVDGEFILDRNYGIEEGLGYSLIRQIVKDSYEGILVLSRDGIYHYNAELDRFLRIDPKYTLNHQKIESIELVDEHLYLLGFQNYKIDLNFNYKNREVPKVYLHELLVNNHRVDLSLKEELMFSHKNNNIEIRYNTIYFSEPSAVSIRYRLKDDQPWMYVSNSSEPLFLTSLSPGNYSFTMQSTVGYIPWKDEIYLKFMIKNPYWKSWWFFVLALAMLFFILYIFFQYRIRQVRKLNDLKIKLAELESETLRAQMNPHFIFNSMNSIKSYIIKNDKENAADYLTIFSELIRSVLRNSMMKEISLSDELEALELYMRLENIRLKDKFTYCIEIGEDLNPNQVAFPPLIIQPFVENSIWHGFINKVGKGHLRIKVSREANVIHVMVKDDGIGRIASRKIENVRKRKRSFGISITETRLQNIMQNCHIDIEDLEAENGGTGTIVRMSLPFKKITNGK